MRTSLHTGAILARAGVVRLERPDTAARVGLQLLRWGPTPAAGYRISALQTPDRPAIHDDRGTVTFGELDRATNALAHGLRGLGVGEGDKIAIFCRDHRGFVFSSVAASKLGASLLLLNTSFAGRQIAQVCAGENPRAVIYDEEFADLCSEAADGRIGVVAWQDSPQRGLTIDQLVAASRTDPLRPPADRGRVVILTSGTTGTPKGASRHQPRSLDPAAALFSRLPLRAREGTLVAAPLFHSWGYAHYTLGLALSSTLVLARRFDPEATLAAIQRHRPSALVVVPVMLTRILELGPETIARYDTGSLRIIAASGSALPGELALRVMDAFGDVLYNLYGSTEVAWATIASPAQLRAAPGTAGTPPRGTQVRLFDDEDREVTARGRHGRIFVANEMVMDGYTSGNGKQIVRGMIATGDVGYLDTAGRLFVAGRDDDMIVSGGENVFPREVEDLLAEHPAIDDAAVIGVADEQFGERLRAFVVPRVGMPSCTAQDERARVRAREPRPLQGAPRRRVRRRAAPQCDRQGPQAGPARTLMARADLFDLGGLRLASGREGRRLELEVRPRTGSSSAGDRATTIEPRAGRRRSLEVSRTTGRRRLRAAAALRRRAQRRLHALPGAGDARDPGGRPRGRRARRRRGARQPLRRRGRRRPAALGPRRGRARRAAAGAVRPGLPGPVPCLRGGARGRWARSSPRGGAGSALGEAARAEARLY